MNEGILVNETSAMKTKIEQIMAEKAFASKRTQIKSDKATEHADVPREAHAQISLLKERTMQVREEHAANRA
jgi:hypothetical protein